MFEKRSTSNNRDNSDNGLQRTPRDRFYVRLEAEIN